MRRDRQHEHEDEHGDSGDKETTKERRKEVRFTFLALSFKSKSSALRSSATPPNPPNPLASKAPHFKSVKLLNRSSSSSTIVELLAAEFVRVDELEFPSGEVI